MSSVPASLAWAVGYVEDKQIRSTMLSLPSNLSSILAGFASDILTLLVSVDGVSGAVSAGLFISLLGALSALAAYYGSKIGFETLNTLQGYQEIGGINTGVHRGVTVDGDVTVVDDIDSGSDNDHDRGSVL